MGEADYITVKGFRSIKSIEKLALRPINVLVGANGSGKSNFVEAFNLLRALRKGRLVVYTDSKGGADKILYFGSKETKQIELEISFRKEVNGYHVCLSPAEGDRFFVHHESCWYWDKQNHPKRYDESLIGSAHEAGISNPQTRIAEWVQKRFDSWRKYHFHDTSESSQIRKMHDVNDNCGFHFDGSNIAPFLLYLKERRQPEYQLIRKTVQRVAPFFDDFQLAPLLRNESKIMLAWKHKTSDRYFDASSLSDGTLRFICLATLFLQPTEFRPSVILVDEPELGLHPLAITMLAEMIKSAAKETQVIAATQSALLLDHFQPEDVLVANLTTEGTTLNRLNSQDLAEWLEEYSLGQLWEKNQFGGRPQRV